MVNILFRGISVFLIPFSVLWSLVHRIRRHFYYYGVLKQAKFQVPIISIGNLSFGGTGKTPFTLWMGQYLESLGMKVMILTRGYKGKLEHSSGIIKAQRKLGFNPEEIGDEATLLARRLNSTTIVVGKNRSANLEYYFEDANPDVVLLDDGHQHLKLFRNLNIVLFDASMPLEKYRVAPLGYLREDFSALRDTDIIVFGKVNDISDQKLNQLEQLIRPYVSKDTIFSKMSYLPTGLYDISYKKKFELSEIKGLKIVAVAGVASPGSFYEILSLHHAKIIRTFTYPDHHVYTRAEMREIMVVAEEYEAMIVTTEKDMVKMRKIVDYKKMLYLEVKLNFINGEDQIKRALLNTLSIKKI